MPVLSEIFSFLGVDPNFRPSSTFDVFNSSILPETQDMLSKLHLGFIVKAVKNLPIGNWIKRHWSVRKNFNHNMIDDKVLNELRTIFHEDIMRLQSMIKKDLSHWLKE